MFGILRRTFIGTAAGKGSTRAVAASLVTGTGIDRAPFQTTIRIVITASLIAIAVALLGISIDTFVSTGGAAANTRGTYLAGRAGSNRPPFQTAIGIVITASLKTIAVALYEAVAQTIIGAKRNRAGAIAACLIAGAGIDRAPFQTTIRIVITASLIAIAIALLGGAAGAFIATGINTITRGTYLAAGTIGIFINQSRAGRIANLATGNCTRNACL
jgi:hypothetical protein